MEPEAFLNSLTPVYEFIYNNEVEVEPLQYPLAFSRYKLPKFANNLYTDNQETYFTYSGLDNSLIVTREKEGRYKNITLRAYSGDSFKFYLQTGSGIADPDMYFSGPLTTSGVYSTLTRYYTQSGAAENAIIFTAPEDNTTIYTLPDILATNWMRLYHQSADGSSPYRIYQFLPRTFIQVDDLSADVIDTVTLRVSGSIVVTADNLAPGSITGEKIMAGTVSGVLITPGTITANEIAAGTITANKLNVNKLSAITSNMGTLTVTEAITVASGYIEAGIAHIDNTGISIGSIDTALPASDALRIIGSGTAGNIVGMAFYNGDFSPTTPQSIIQIDSSNALEIENNKVDGVTNINFPTDSYTSQVGIYNGSLNLRRTIDPTYSSAESISGFDSEDTLQYSLGQTGLMVAGDVHANSSIYSEGPIYSYNSLITTDPITTQDTFTVDAVTGNVEAYGNIGTKVNITASGTIQTFNKLATVDSFSNLDTFSVDAVTGDITSIGDLRLSSDLIINTNKFSVTGSTGDVAISGNLISKSISDTTALTLNTSTRSFTLMTPRINYAENAGKPTLTITGSGTSGTSGSIILNNSSVATAGQRQGYINMDGNATLEVSNTVTSGNLHFNLPNNGFYRVYVNSPANPQLLVDSTNVTVGNAKVIMAAASGNTTIAGTLDVTGQTTLGALNASGTIGFGASNNKFTVASATGNTAVAGTLDVTGKLISSYMGYLTLRRNTTQSITTAGTTIVWNTEVRANNITWSSDTITVTNAGYYLISATFATVDNLTSLRMTLAKGTVNYASTLHGAGLSTGGGYIFNMSIGFWATANSTYKITLVPSANTTLNANSEGFAGPSPIINIIQTIGV